MSGHDIKNTNMPTPDSKISGALKTILKKYWWILTISIFAPIIINFSLLIPSFTPVVGTNIEWLSFFGSYIAAIIPALGSFIILFIQREDNHRENKKREWENERNRQLQLDVLKYQQEMQWLNENREILIDCALALDKDHLVELAHKLEISQDILYDVKSVLDNLVRCDSTVGFMYVSQKTEEYNDFNTQRSSAYIMFRDALLDLQEINILFRQTGFNRRRLVLQERLQQGYIHKGLNAVISKFPSEQDFLNSNAAEVSAMLISITPDLFEETRKAALTYIKSEENRISRILIKELSNL